MERRDFPYREFKLTIMNICQAQKNNARTKREFKQKDRK